ncbi:MAG: hypothetical protein ACJ74O_06115 [Frankiaceae bacterium]
MSAGWQSPRSWLERLIGACLGVLLCALMLHVAAVLIESAWVVLAVTAGAGLMLVAAVVWWRGRFRDW